MDVVKQNYEFVLVIEVQVLGDVVVQIERFHGTKIIKMVWIIVVLVLLLFVNAPF